MTETTTQELRKEKEEGSMSGLIRDEEAGAEDRRALEQKQFNEWIKKLFEQCTKRREAFTVLEKGDIIEIEIRGYEEFDPRKQYKCDTVLTDHFTGQVVGVKKKKGKDLRRSGSGCRTSMVETFKVQVLHRLAEMDKLCNPDKHDTTFLDNSTGEDVLKCFLCRQKVIHVTFPEIYTFSFYRVHGWLDGTHIVASLPTDDDEKTLWRNSTSHEAKCPVGPGMSDPRIVRKVRHPNLLVSFYLSYNCSGSNKRSHGASLKLYTDMNIVFAQ